ncbi:alpha/beta fold hydrolase [Egbenema bharatensis]|uniref:alpha/beta fold hydrolase n=1 Tax=Egbenema bharatensis TaxID=3463334 RepID=UPI003A892D58
MTRFSLSTDRLTEPTSIALVQAIQQQAISTSLSPDPIATAFVRQGSAQLQNQSQNLPILFLHGFDSSMLEFRRLMPLLADHTETWAIDLLGFGFTERVPQLLLDPAAIKTHLYATWEHLIGQPVVLVGASMGGAAAIDFALTYPEAVSQLILIDSAGFTVGPSVGKFLIPPLGYLATAFLRNPKVRQSISLKAYHDPSLASLDAQYCAALHLEQPGWQQALINFTRSGGYTSFRDKLAHLQSPTLILWGQNDRILGTADAEKFQQAIPQSELIWIENCGHVPHLEKPQTTADYILSFIRQQSLVGDRV